MGDTCVSVYDHPDPKCKGFSMSASKLKRKFVASWSTGDVKIMSY